MTLSSSEVIPSLLGVSLAIQRVRHAIVRIAPTTLPVLLVGETGTGKDLCARYLHHVSGHGGAWVDVNCAALPAAMIESLLFGHVRGAFTGADRDLPGLVELASTGTLFLDELCSLSTEGQAKLLRVLETGEVRRLGALTSRAVHLRPVAALQHLPEELIARGALRRDLFQRLAGLVVVLPPLRERVEDLLPLAEHFARRLGRGLERECSSLLLAYPWPGNVRELKMTVERAAAFAGSSVLSRQAISEALDAQPPQAAGESAALMETPTYSHEAAALLEVCRAHQWCIEDAARCLGVHRATLYRRLRRAGIAVRQAARTHAVRPATSQLGAAKSHPTNAKSQLSVTAPPLQLAVVS